MGTKQNVKTRQTIHSMTVGVSYKIRGRTYTNAAGQAWGKADCGTVVATGAQVTTEPVQCAKCVALQ